MSSFYELTWRDSDLEKYSTDKLYFIWNIVKQPIPSQYREMLGELKWRQQNNKRKNDLQRIKEIISKRDDKNEIRQEWRNLHPKEVNVKKEGKTISELAHILPNMAQQLGAFIELENIEIKYFDEIGEPIYELSDFKDIFPKNYIKSGFRKYGISVNQLLALYPNINNDKLMEFLKQIDLEKADDGTVIIPYYDAVGIKRLLIDEN